MKSYKSVLSKDLVNYNEVIGIKGIKNQFFTSPISDQRYIWKYIKTLRKCEFYSHGGIFKVFRLLYLHRLRKLSRITGFQIPPNTIGAGLTIWHWGPIIINPKVRIGENCVLNPMVVIGHKKPNEGAPKIGNNVFIGSGAKIIGDISIGNNVVIAPNAVVTKDVPSNVVVAGIPCKVIKEIT